MIPTLFRTISLAVILTVSGGCANRVFESDPEYAMALDATREVVDRVRQMPVEDLGKLAFSRKLQQEWQDRQAEVFAGTPYLAASIRHHDASNHSSSRYWGPKRRSLVVVGLGRPAFGGYLGVGKAKTPDYTGPTYVYTIREGWTHLAVHIAAPERKNRED